MFSFFSFLRFFTAILFDNRCFDILGYKNRINLYIFFLIRNFFEYLSNVFSFHYFFFFKKLKKESQNMDQSKMIIGNVNISIENNSCYWRYSFENSIYRHGYSLMPAQCSVDLMKR